MISTPEVKPASPNDIDEELLGWWGVSSQTGL
jgi:hypothetical protein